MLVDLPGVVKGFAGDHGNDVKGDAALPEEIEPPDGGLVRAYALAGLAMGVVEKGRAVDAQADGYLLAADEVAPLLIEQGAVRLERVVDFRAGRDDALDGGDGFLVPADGHGEGLPGVPDEGQVAFDEAGGEGLLDGGLQDVHRHAPSRGAIWQVAVVAVDIAERRWLKNQNGNPRIKLLAWGIHTGPMKMSGGRLASLTFGIRR